MATETEFPAGVDAEFFRALRVVQGRAVAVFALDGSVPGGGVGRTIFRVALMAGVPALVFDRHCLPFLNIPTPVEAVGEIPAMHPEIPGHEEVSDQQKKGDGPQDQIERPPYVVFHKSTSLAVWRRPPEQDGLAFT